MSANVAEATVRGHAGSLFAGKRDKPYLGRRTWNLTLAVLIVIAGSWATAASPLFLHVHQLLIGSQTMVVSGILALGLAPVVLVGEIDISLTSNLACCTIVVGLLSNDHVTPVLIMLATLATGVGLGLINGILVGYGGLPSLAVTLGTMAAFQGGGYLVGGMSDFTSFPSGIYAIGANSIGQVPISLFIFVGVAAVLAVLLRLTSCGRSFYAVGRASEAVRRSGISVSITKTAAFAIAGMTAGIAALIFVGQYGSGGADSGSGTILTVVTAVALGGMDIYGGAGRISGVVLAVVLLDVVQNGMGLVNISTTIETIVIGSILVGSLGLPELFGRLGAKRLVTPWRGLEHTLRLGR